MQNLKVKANKIKPASFKLSRESFRYYYFPDLKPIDSIILNFMIYRLRLSVAYGYTKTNGKRYYNPKDNQFYYSYTIHGLVNDLPFKIGSNTVQRSLNRLNNTKYLHKNRKEYRLEIELPFLKDVFDDYLSSTMVDTSTNYQNGVSRNTKMGLKCKNRNNKNRNNKLHSNTPQKIRDFSRWRKTTLAFLVSKLKLSSKKALLLVDSLSKFYGNYSKKHSLEKWVNVILYQARNYWIRQSKKHKNITINGNIKLEDNINFKHDIALAVSQTFAKIEAITDYNQEHHTNKTPNANEKAINYMVSSLKNDFELWLDVDIKDSKPTKEAHKDTNKAIIRTSDGNKVTHNTPDWVKDDYKVKLKPTTKAHIDLIHKQQKEMNHTSSNNESKESTAKPSQSAENSATKTSSNGFGIYVDMDTETTTNDESNNNEPNDNTTKENNSNNPNTSDSLRNEAIKSIKDKIKNTNISFNEARSLELKYYNHAKAINKFEFEPHLAIRNATSKAFEKLGGKKPVAEGADYELPF